MHNMCSLSAHVNIARVQVRLQLKFTLLFLRVVMSANYQRLMKLLEKWPVDKSKIGRDLGEHLRNQLKDVINPAAVSTQLSADFQKQAESLERIANNVYAKKYKRSLTSTATGLSAEQCSQVLSSEFLEYLNEERSVFSRKK